MVLVILLLVLATAYFLNQYFFSYWSRRGIKQFDPQFPFGNAGPLFKMKSQLGPLAAEIYNKYKSSRLVGFYMSYKPTLIVTDPKLVQDILIRDFSYFHDRPTPSDKDKDPLSGHLFNITGQQWRDLRVKLTPTFTSGKLKGMFSTIKDVAQVLEVYLDKNLREGNNVFEFKDLMARFNTNIISSVAFGIENDCINEPDHIFRRMGEKIFEPTFMFAIRGLFFTFGPSLFYKVGLRSIDKEIEDFIFSIVKQTVEHREKNNITRNDFIQLLIQLKNQGYVTAGKEESEAGDTAQKAAKKMTIDELAAQVFVFFVAGFDTSSSTLSFCLFEIARNQALQRKVQAEIDKVLESGFTYDSLTELKYVESCIDETLRKYPIVPVHLRMATKDYKVKDSNWVIPKGTSIFIPVLGFHRDPEIYENPMEFKPERFMDSSNGGGKVEGIFYTPFGDGPRNCIGMRMGKTTTKVALASILSKFNLELTDKEMIDKELEFHPTQFGLVPLKPFNIKISPRV